MADASVVVDFVANTRGLQKGAKEAQGATSKLGSGLKSFGKAAVFGGVAAGAAALTATLKIGWDEYQQGAQVAAQTNAVIKSTGSAAHVSADQVDALASSLMKKSGIDDEVIKSGENMLLTFTNVRNEAGKGNDVFNQATKTMTDMSVALGTDAKTSAMQLGKALNDPVKGMTALQRVGVTFTEAQKKQVAAMVKSGDTIGAQKLILHELNKEFGGSAKAMGDTLPGKINVLKQEFSNFAGDLVGKIVPVLMKLVAWVQKNWPLIQAAFEEMWAKVQPILKLYGTYMTEVLLPALGDVVRFIQANWPAISAAMGEVANFIRTRVIPVVQAVIGFLIDNWPTIASVIKQTWDVVQPLMIVLAQRFADIVEIVAKVVGFIQDNWPKIAPVVNAVVAVIGDVLKIVRDVVKLVTALLKGDWGQAWEMAKKIVQDVVNLIRDLLHLAVEEWKLILIAAWAAIQAGAAAAWDLIKKAISAAIAFVGSELGKIPTKIAAVIAGAKAQAGLLANAIKDAVIAAAKAAVSGVSTEMGKISGKISAVVHAVGVAAGKVASAIKDAISGAVSDAVAAVGGLGSKLVSKLEAIPRTLAKSVSSIASAIKGPINAVISGWNALHVPGFSIGGGTHGSGLLKITIPKVAIPGIDLPNISPLAKGGVVSSPTLALVGEAGREIVAPEALLRQIMSEHGGSYTLNLTTTRADAADVAWGFRRLELLRTGR